MTDVYYLVGSNSAGKTQFFLQIIGCMRYSRLEHVMDERKRNYNLVNVQTQFYTDRLPLGQTFSCAVHKSSVKFITRNTEEPAFERMKKIDNCWLGKNDIEILSPSECKVIVSAGSVDDVIITLNAMKNWNITEMLIHGAIPAFVNALRRKTEVFDLNESKLKQMQMVFPETCRVVFLEYPKEGELGIERLDGTTISPGDFYRSYGAGVRGDIKRELSSVVSQQEKAWKRVKERESALEKSRSDLVQIKRKVAEKSSELDKHVKAVSKLEKEVAGIIDNLKRRNAGFITDHGTVIPEKVSDFASIVKKDTGYDEIKEEKIDHLKSISALKGQISDLMEAVDLYEKDVSKNYRYIEKNKEISDSYIKLAEILRNYG